MNFDEWFRQEGYAEEHREVFRTVWNAAIDVVGILIAENYDECEPWITPNEMSELKG